MLLIKSSIYEGHVFGCEKGILSYDRAFTEGGPIHSKVICCLAVSFRVLCPGGIL